MTQFGELGVKRSSPACGSLTLLRHALVDPSGHLSQYGRRQAHETARGLTHITVVYTSAQQRARETAAELGFPECRTNGALEPIDAVLGAQLGVGFAGMERASRTDQAIARAASRLQAFTDHVIAEHPDQHVLAITHSGVIELLTVAVARSLDLDALGGRCRNLAGVRLDHDATEVTSVFSILAPELA